MFVVSTVPELEKLLEEYPLLSFEDEDLSLELEECDDEEEDLWEELLLLDLELWRLAASPARPAGAFFWDPELDGEPPEDCNTRSTWLFHEHGFL